MMPVSICCMQFLAGLDTHDMFILQNSSAGLHFDQAANGDTWFVGEILFFSYRQN